MTTKNSMSPTFASQNRAPGTRGSAAVAKGLVEGMRMSGLVPVLAKRAPAPTQWDYARAAKRGGRAMIGRNAVSSKKEDVLKRLERGFNELFSWCSFGSNADEDPERFFRMPCAQCGRAVTVFKASEKKRLFPAGVLGTCRCQRREG